MVRAKHRRHGAHAKDLPVALKIALGDLHSIASSPVSCGEDCGRHAAGLQV